MNILSGIDIRNKCLPRRGVKAVACGRFWGSVPILALNSGMRRSELLSLEWSRVDLNHRTIRVVPMNAAVHSLLTEIAKAVTSPLVFPSNRKPGERFLDLKKGVKKAVKKAVELAGIPHVRFHDLCATRLQRGWSGRESTS